MKAVVYLVQLSVDCNFNNFELGFFEGLLAALGIKDYETQSFTEHYRAYTFVTTKENEALIDGVCKERDIHMRKGNVKINL